MVVNFEFLCEEPIDNVITCRNYAIDKVVYFAYHDTLQKYKHQTEEFLKRYCGVQRVVFHELSDRKLQSVLNVMRNAIRFELDRRNQIYFDISGGEDLMLVAFGMLSKEFETPMHMYDVERDDIIELDEGAKACLSKDVKERIVPITIDLLISLQGGIIKKESHKELEGAKRAEFLADSEKIYQVSKQFHELWNPFSMLIRKIFTPLVGDDLRVSKRARDVIAELQNSRTNLRTVRQLNQILDTLADEGILLDMVHADGVYSFSYKNDAIQECLWKSGSILELHTCRVESKHSDECHVGVHLDWDGILHEQPQEDVLNEIDVLALKGNILTFISCKSGRMKDEVAMNALYELETVANRFGGRYAKKILVTAQAPRAVDYERAKEMGIVIRWENDPDFN